MYGAGVSSLNTAVCGSGVSIACSLAERVDAARMELLQHLHDA